MIVLDTNIVSELQKLDPDPNVSTWIEQVDRNRTYLCGPVVMEQAFGAELYFLRNRSNRYLDNFSKTMIEFADRTLVVDIRSCETAGRIRARRERMGRPISTPDAMIAAICLVHGATLATRNVRDFDGLDLKLVNPFEAAA